MSRSVRLLVFCGVSLAVRTTAFAQVPATAPTEKWEVSVHLGGLTATNPTSGVATLPPAVESLALATGGSGPRASSWLFGDGARLLNDVNAQLGIGVRVTPLDAVLASSMVQSPGTMVFGFRVARMITRRVSTELSVDYSPTFFGTTESETRIDTRPSSVEGPAFEDVPTIPFRACSRWGRRQRSSSATTRRPLGSTRA